MSAAQVRSYLNKAEEFLAAATAELEAGRSIAATSLAIHAAINAADAVTGSRTGRRARLVRTTTKCARCCVTQEKTAQSSRRTLADCFP